MQYGLIIPNMGPYSDTRKLADLAYEAEQAGWHGLFLWDTIHYLADNQPVSDPWIALAAVAMRTQTLKIGLQVTIPSRRRPWKMARETVTLDQLSNGRLILGVGSGDDSDKGFGHFGEEMDAKKRGKMLDESLDILQGLWSGKPFSYNGEHYHVDEITFLPRPVQQPRITIWAGWVWPRKKPLERAIRLDGASPFSSLGSNGIDELSPDEIRQLKAVITERRTLDTPYDIAIGAPIFEAQHNPQALATLQASADAGATWLLERIFLEHDFKKVHTAIKQGPPKLA